MPQITVYRIFVSVVATDGTQAREVSCATEPEAKHLLTRLQNDQRAAYKFLHQEETEDCC